MSELLAFHGDPAFKAELLAHLAAHRKADEIVQGTYWEDGKGCHVGCSLESIRRIKGLPEVEHDDHMRAEAETGIPVMIWRLSDTIFEGLSEAKAKNWPERFTRAIEPGADLSLIGWKFLHWLITDEKVNPGINDPLVKDAVEQCADVLVPLIRGDPVDVGAARSAAKSAAWGAARSAAWSAAWSAESAAEMELAYERMANKLLALMKTAPVAPAPE